MNTGKCIFIGLIVYFVIALTFTAISHSAPIFARYAEIMGIGLGITVLGLVVYAIVTDESNPLS